MLLGAMFVQYLYLAKEAQVTFSGKDTHHLGWSPGAKALIRRDQRRTVRWVGDQQRSQVDPGLVAWLMRGSTWGFDPIYICVAYNVYVLQLASGTRHMSKVEGRWCG